MTVSRGTPPYRAGHGREPRTRTQDLMRVGTIDPAIARGDDMTTPASPGRPRSHVNCRNCNTEIEVKDGKRPAACPECGHGSFSATHTLGGADIGVRIGKTYYPS